jgi:hypothetical protein
MTEDRVKRAQKAIEEYLPEKPQYILDTSEFEEVKTRLAALMNERKLHLGKAGPTLRRAQTAPDTSDTTPEDDERPTLKRPPH